MSGYWWIQIAIMLVLSVAYISVMPHPPEPREDESQAPPVDVEVHAT